jgi:hypothetical protein
MENWFNELKDQIDDFFKNATDEEIQATLKKSDYHRFKEFDIKLIDDQPPKERDFEIFESVATYKKPWLDNIVIGSIT